jgi:pyridoxal 5'-phosphate synthase pdxS subunit
MDNDNGKNGRDRHKSTATTKVGLAEMLKGGVIMDVVNADQARLAEAAGAAAVMALERVPAEIRRQGGVARASDPAMIRSIQQAVSIPVMAKCRIGHFIEARILEALEVDFIDESEVLTPADDQFHIDKHAFRAPFVCGCRDLGEALRRIAEGASMLRTKGEAGTGNVVEAVRHLRALRTAIRRLSALARRAKAAPPPQPIAGGSEPFEGSEFGRRAKAAPPPQPIAGGSEPFEGSEFDEEELGAEAKTLGAPLELVREVARAGRLPVPSFAAGGIATPADAALCMALGAEAVFVGSGIFLSQDPARRAAAIVDATTYFGDPERLAAVSAGLGEPMRGTEIASLPADQRYAARGV